MTRVRILFGGAVFLASFLLFLVEPIAAKQLLPVLGGSAAVWITCLVFFQTALLCAYLYAHWLARRQGWIVHCTLLAIALGSAIVWAVRSVTAGSGAGHPFLTLLTALSTSIGLPFLALGATSPLMQVWWARLHRAGIPYRLFALSNLASLLALGLYPALIEPNLTLRAQRLVWCCGFAIFAVISGILAWKTRSATEDVPQVSGDDRGQASSKAITRLFWLLLPMGAAMQLSAVTSFITANVAAIPLLWILPLAVYLLTLIIAFQFPRLAPRSIVSRFLIVMLAGLGYMLSQVDVTHPMIVTIGFLLMELFFACLLFHCEAYALRPVRASESTAFYLLFAAGGALGSCLIGIVAPLLYRYNFDLAITFFITALLALLATWRGGWNQRMLWAVASVLMAILVSWIHTATVRGTMVAVRNFYGSLRVKQDYSYPGATVRTLMNGTIQHGTQVFGADMLRKTPTTYYAEDSGVGLALRFCCADQPRNIGVIGLGAGTLAAYGKAGDRIRFYEINPAVAPIANNVFTYIRESGAEITIVDGDGRMALGREAPQGFDVLVVDAFSGDAIPLHLLTREAVELYRKHLAPGGVIAFHISNQHVDLEPPIARLARDANMRAVRVSTNSKPDLGEFNASWMLVGGSPAFFERPELFKAGKVPEQRSGLRLWTDDFSSLLPVLRW
jgi:hypothetical protein